VCGGGWFRVFGRWLTLVNADESRWIARLPPGPGQPSSAGERRTPAAHQRLSACENCGVQRYAVVIHEDPDGGFWAEVPALPGCYSQADRVDELMENVREAIAGVLEVMSEQGKQPESNIQILDIAV
jgi:predicted RNase H-like HicB family nuclease